MKQWNVWIYDSESGCDQPMKTEAKTEAEARRLGEQYIRRWNLQNASITRIEKVME